VEAKSIGGYSGSPVFVHLAPLSARPQKNDPHATPLVVPFPGIGPWLLGIDWGHLTSWEPVMDDTGHPIRQGWKVNANTGMMGVVPAWKLEEMLRTEKVKEFVKTQEDGYKKKIAGAVGATDSAPATQSTVGKKKSAKNPHHKEDFNHLLRAAVRGKKSTGKT